ncbi:MAG: oligosaccharide flippase family protein [Acidobacteria bacterium]|nr:oligosaccharide flippase family protein [Acidobacteriota bacterium]
MTEGNGAGPSRAILTRLAGATANYGLGSFIPQLVGFLLIPVYTRFLTPEDYGKADVVAALGAVLVIIFRLGISGAVTRYYFEHREGEPLSRYLSTVAWFLVASTAVCATGITIAGPATFNVIAPGVPFFPLGIMGIWTAAFGVLPDLMRRLLQAMERSREHMLLTFLEFTITVGGTLAMVVGLRMGVTGVVLAPFLASVVMTLVSLRFMSRYWKWRFDESALRSSLAYGAPMLPHHLAAWITGLASRLFVNGLANASEAGVFGIATRFTSPLTMTFTAMNAAWIPIYFGLRKSGSKGDEVGRLHESLFLFVTGTSVAAALLGRDAALLVLPPSFHAGAALIPVMALTACIRGFYLIAVAEIFFVKTTWWVSAATFLGSLVTVAGNLWLVPRWGATGSSWAMVAANSLTTAIVIAAARRTRGSGVRSWRLIIVFVTGVLAVCLRVTLPRVGVADLAVDLGILLAFGSVAAALGVLKIGVISHPLIGWKAGRPSFGTPGLVAEERYREERNQGGTAHVEPEV